MNIAENKLLNWKIRLRNSRGRKKKTINRNYKEKLRDMKIERELLISR